MSSHSMRKTILRDYEAAGLPTPELIFDWACPEGKRKPHPYALQETMRILNLKPEELLMVDDLKPGYDMAKACGVRLPVLAGRITRFRSCGSICKNTVITILRRQQN